MNLKAKREITRQVLRDLARHRCDEILARQDRDNVTIILAGNTQAEVDYIDHMFQGFEARVSEAVGVLVEAIDKADEADDDAQSDCLNEILAKMKTVLSEPIVLSVYPKEAE